jgi:ribonuclease E
VLREQLEPALHNWLEQFTPGVAGPKPVKVQVETDEPAPKKAATARKTAPKKTTAKNTAAKKTAAAKKAAAANKTTVET